MKKLWISCMLAASLVATSAAHADGWYGAFDYGYSSIGIDGNGYHTPTNRGYRIAGGYDVDPYLSLEAGYVYFGHAGVTTCTTTVGTVCNDFVLKPQAYTFDALVHKPLGFYFSLFARLGVNRGQLEADYDTGTSSTTNSTGLDWGIGADFLFLEDWKLRLQFAQYQNFGSTTTAGHGNVSLTSVGVSYSF